MLSIGKGVRYRTPTPAAAYLPPRMKFETKNTLENPRSSHAWKRLRHEWSVVRSVVIVAWTRALQVSSNPFRKVAKRVNMMSTMPRGVSASSSSGRPSRKHR